MVGNKESWTYQRRSAFSKTMSGSNNPMFGKKRPAYIIEAMRQGLIGKPSFFRGKHHNKHALFVLSQKAKQRWACGMYTIETIKKWYQANNFGITNPEQIVYCLLKELNLNFKFTGNCSFFIGRFCPDFVNIKDKKIIEVYGRYWHSKPKKIEKDQRRILKYRQAGFKTLIVYDNETKDTTKLINKLYNFNK